MKQDRPLVRANVDIARVYKCHFERVRKRRQASGHTRRKDKVCDNEWRLAYIEGSVHLVKGFLDLLTRFKVIRRCPTNGRAYFSGVAGTAVNEKELPVRGCPTTTEGKL